MVLGANAVVLSPVQIGDHATVAAGSLVIRNVGAFELVGGVPARRLAVGSRPERT